MTDYPPAPFTRSDAIKVIAFLSVYAATLAACCKWSERMEQKRRDGQAGRGL